MIYTKEPANIFYMYVSAARADRPDCPVLCAGLSQGSKSTQSIIQLHEVGRVASLYCTAT